MPIFKNSEHTVLHIHIPKTGGSTLLSVFNADNWVQSLIGPRAYAPCTTQHFHYSLLANEYNITKDFTYTFTIVRNPYTRAISEFTWKPSNKGKSFNEWFYSFSKGYEDNNFIGDNHFRPQYHFLGRGVSRVFSLEDGYNNIIGEIKNTLGKQHFPESYTHSNKKRFSIDLANIDYDMIYDFYRIDFEGLGYEKNSYPT